LCDFATLVERVVTFAVALLILLAVIMLAITGLQMAVSAGNGDALSVLKERMTNIVLGFFLIIASWTIIDTMLKALVVDPEVTSFWNAAMKVGQRPSNLCFGQEVPTFESLTDIDPNGSIVVSSLPIAGTVDTGDQICFPGDGVGGQVCFNKKNVPDEGDYKYSVDAPLGYERPGYFIDLSEVNPDTKLSPNFTVGELAQLYKGRYAYIDPRIPQLLEGVRTDLGSEVVINSGYRSPGYNSKLEGAAEHSRHQYGDAVDIAIPAGKTSTDIVNSCKARGAHFTKVYSNHVHCDWR
jgi:hypothetical protein